MVYPNNIAQYLEKESLRQHASVEPMARAYEIAKMYEGPLTEQFILSLGKCFGFSWYRTTPVTFAHGGNATKAQLIPEALPRLISHAPEKGEFTAWYPWIKAFLQMHTFEDGNGRIASLLFNWGMSTLNEPFPLPYYKF